jgi:hypothetical protein
MIDIYGDAVINGRLILTVPPSSPSDAVSLSFVQGLISSSKTLGPCALALLSNTSLNGLSTIQSYAIQAGDRILVTSQTNPISNGVYIAGSGAWVRSSDFNAGLEGSNTLVSIISGDSAGTIYKSQSTSFIVNTGACYFTALSANNSLSSYAYRSVTSSGSINGNDIYILADCSAGNITLTLPVSSSVASVTICRMFRVIKIDNTTNKLTIRTTAPDSFLDGLTQYSTNVPGKQIELTALFSLQKYSAQ